MGRLGDVAETLFPILQCLVMFPIVKKLGNIFARNIVSYQCFVMIPSVGKLGNIFVRNIVSYIAMFCHVSHCGKTLETFF